MRWQLLLLGSLYLFCSSLGAVSPVILILGDSLSSGYGIDASKSWPQLLQKRLQHDSLNYQVVNISISGETSHGGLKRFPVALDKYQPAIVILELGGNDGLMGLSISAMETNLTAMIQYAKKSAARVLLVGMRLPPNYGKSYTAKFHAVYHRLAAHHDVSLLPFMLKHVANNAGLMQADGIHPKQQAQTLIVDNVWPVLLPLISKPKQDHSRTKEVSSPPLSSITLHDQAGIGATKSEAIGHDTI